jgi:hypothetical protein
MLIHVVCAAKKKFEFINNFLKSRGRQDNHIYSTYVLRCIFIIYIFVQKLSQTIVQSTVESHYSSVNVNSLDKQNLN